MRIGGLVAVIVLGATSPVRGQDEPSLPRSAVRGPDAVAMQVVVGGLGALVGSIGFAYLGAAALGPHGGEDPGLVGAIVGASLGIVVGGGLGVGVTARNQGYERAMPAALGGAALGLLALFPVGNLVRLDADYAPFWLATFGLPITGAIVSTALADRWERGVMGRVSPTVMPTRAGARIGLRASF